MKEKNSDHYQTCHQNIKTECEKKVAHQRSMENDFKP